SPLAHLLTRVKPPRGDRPRDEPRADRPRHGRCDADGDHRARDLLRLDCACRILQTATAMLSPDQIARYHRDGYVVPDFRVPEETLAAIRSRHAALLEREPRFRDYCATLLDYDAAFLDYADNPAILDMVEQIIGSDIALWNMSFFAKPALSGKRTPWHQDGEYWPIQPLATCTVLLALDGSTPENGCLRVIRG